MLAQNRTDTFLKFGDRVVFLGDSITQRALYTQYIEEWVRAFHPYLEVQFFNAGKGSDNAADGLRRLEKDVLVHVPTVVVLCYGMNDAVVREPNAAVDPSKLETYLESHRKIIRRLRDSGVRPFLMTPPICRLDLTGELAGHHLRLKVYADALKKLASSENVPIADVYHLLLEREPIYRSHSPNGQSLIPDGVHPAEHGCLLMAMEVLRQWGLASHLPRAKDSFLKKGDRVVFLGDSITEQAYYTKYIESWVWAFHPELEVQFLNAGKGGETAPGGLARLEEDVLRRAPTVVTVLYGANDGGRTDNVAPDRLEAYQTGMREIVRRLRAHNIRPFVLTCIGVAEDRSVDLKGTNRAWRVLVSACLDMACEENVPVVDLFHPMVAQSAIYRLYYPNDRLVWDGVHPRGPGSLFIAMHVLLAWGLAD